MANTEALLKTFIDFMHSDFSDMKKSVTQLIEENLELTKKVEYLEKRLNLSEGLITQLRVKTTAQAEEITDLKCRSMRDNIVIQGIQEDDNETWENTKNKVREFLTNTMKMDGKILAIDRAHRIGVKGQRPRAIVVKFLTSTARESVFGHVKHLKGLNQYSIQEQLPAEVTERRKHLWPQYKAAKDAGDKPRWSVDKLVVKGRQISALDDHVQFDPAVDLKNEIDVNLAHTGHKLEEGSTFIGHAATVKNASDVPIVLAKLLQDQSIAKATHNAYAYRIGRIGSNNLKEGIKDDGEHGAGLKILQQIQERGATNIIVIVSRFYGGKHMGPKRFDCFKDSAQEAIDLIS